MPTNPAVCPILSLAIYFACFPGIRGPKVFPRETQTEHFRKQSRTALLSPQLQAPLAEHGLVTDDIGTKSIGHERTEDVTTTETETAAPQFSTLEPIVLAAVRSTFPVLVTVTPSLAQLRLASLLFHDDFLEATLPPSHPLRQTLYYRGVAQEQALFQYVRPSESNAIPTVEPEIIDIPTALRITATALGDLTSAIQALPAAVTGRDNTTDLRTVVTQVLREHGVFEAVARLQAAAAIAMTAEPVEAPTPTPAPAPPPPPTYSLPKGSLLSAWQCWLGGPHPLRSAPSTAFEDKNDRKRLSDLKFLMRELSHNVQAFVAIQQPTDAQVDEAFLQTIAGVHELSRTVKGRARRLDQVHWTSAATALRNQQTHKRLRTV